MKHIHFFALLIGLLLPTIFLAQKKYVVVYKPQDSGALNYTPNLTTQFANQLQAKLYIDKLTTEWIAKGFITAAIDSVHYTADTAKVLFFLGLNYTWKNIDLTNINAADLQQVGWLTKSRFTGNDFMSIYNLQQKLLNHYQEIGFPFAKVKVDSIVIDDKFVSGRLTVDKGVLHKIDSIRIIGSVKVNNNFLQNFLKIKNGSIYKKSVLDNIPSRLQQLPYLEQQSPFDFTMLASSSVVNLYLKPRKSSIVNVLLGLIPAPNPNGIPGIQQNKLFLSGDANILLNNALSMGETMGLTYQQLSINSRRINLLYKHPYIFNSNYSLETAFELYKRDSSYLNIEANIGALYNLSSSKTAKVFFQYFKTNTFPDTSFVKLTKKLPDNLDVKLYNLGITYDVNTTDYRRNPRRGSEALLTGLFGTKTITKNSAIATIKDNSFNYKALYDTINLNTYQVRLKATVAKYIKISKQSVLKLAANGGLLLSQNYLRNELFQIGGFKLLRGFDEESQFCNQYAIATAELRYLIGGDSYFFVFSDGGYTANPLISSKNRTYISGGLGLNFATKSGLFNLSVAAGTRNDIPFGLRQAKLHFGYVAVF